MPVSGSIAAASWAKRPSPASGVGLRFFVGSAGSTSNTKPWSLVNTSSPAFHSVSSQVIHVPHGVLPPAQLPTVPATLKYSETTPLLASSSVVVVPPTPSGS